MYYKDNKTEIIETSGKADLKLRQSGIELLKIIAMLGIVLYHCAVSIKEDNSPFIQYVDITKPAANFTFFMFQIIFYLGMLGNMIFFISSAWFLIDSDNIKINKISGLISDNYVFSVTILLIFFGGGDTLFC